MSLEHGIVAAAMPVITSKPTFKHFHVNTAYTLFDNVAPITPIIFLAVQVPIDILELLKIVGRIKY